MTEVDDLSWMDDAACYGVDPDLFFPGPGEGQADPAKQVCRHCDVRPQCLIYAFRNGEHHGVWGGLAEHERRKVRVQMSNGIFPTIDGVDLSTVDLSKPRTFGPCHTEPRCGTYSGFSAHRRRKEDACAPCREARNEWKRRYEAEKKLGEAS